MDCYTSLILLDDLQSNCRFELPFDLKLLENVSPTEYICKYSIISQRRDALYQSVFKKHKNSQNEIPFKRLLLAINDVSVCEIDPAKISQLLTVTEIKENQDVSEPLFRGICALADRLVFSKLVLEDETKEDQKVGVEKVDFHGLRHKLRDVNISTELYILLLMI